MPCSDQDVPAALRCGHFSAPMHRILRGEMKKRKNWRCAHFFKKLAVIGQQELPHHIGEIRQPWL